jgi:Domain of unknown function (DUF222)
MTQPPPSERGPAEEPARDSGVPGGDSDISGSAPRAPGGARDPRLAGFVEDGPGDARPPSAALAVVVEELSGPQQRCEGATDDELIGLLGRWDALEAWAAAGKLGVIRELIRRRARPGPGGYQPAHGDLPDQWHEGLAHEVSAALGLSIRGADRLTCFAWDLAARLPGIGSALAAGTISEWKAKLISDELAVLDDEHAAEAEKLILDQVAGQPPGMIGKLAAQAVCTVDPDGAAKRREHAEREEARVRFWRANGGACALAAYGLPTDAALAANDAIEDRARRYKLLKVRPNARLDQLRVLAFLDILNGITLETRLAQSRTDAAAEQDRTTAAEQYGPPERGLGGAPDGGTPAGTANSGTSDEDRDAYDWDAYFGDRVDPGDDVPDVSESAASDRNDASTADSSAPDEGAPGPGVPDDDWFTDTFGDVGESARLQSPGPGTADDGYSGNPAVPPVLPGLAARGNLTLPLATLLGMAERPGAGHELGPLDPALVRDLAASAANNPSSEWCLTITDGEGVAVAHGCARPARTKKTSPPPASRDGPPGPMPWALTPRDEPGPPGGYGTWTLTLPGGRELAVKLVPVPVSDCDHRHESHGYQPNDTLRHLVQIRDGTCTFPTCSAHARESDFEHAVPYDQGGKTCACNGGARSRRCHRVKQSPGWTVTQPEPGLHQWTTPSGRTYTQGPMRYPA